MVIAAYERWAERCVERFRGDWAFVLWDEQRALMLCAKDPVGWEPLYYRVEQDLFAAAGDPLPLTRLGESAPQANRDYLRRHLAGALQAPGSTPYEDVAELEGGETLVVETATFQRRRYWGSPEPDREMSVTTPASYVDEFEARFAQAVRARLPRRGRTAVYLSGGLDSSYLTAVAAREGADLVAVTAYSANDGVDERPQARAVALALGIQHVELDVSDCWAFSSRWMPAAVCDDPAMPPQGPHIRKLAATARELGCSVVLTGDGGDEWLSGDRRTAADALLHGKPRAAWRLAGAGRTRSRGAVLAAQVADAMWRPLEARLRTRPASNPAMTELVEGDPHWTFLTEIGSPSLVRNRRSREREWQLYRAVTRSPLAWRHRHAVAANALRLGAPFNDLNVLELLAKAPEWVKRFRGRPRDLLREAGARLLPRAVFDRSDKVYFDGLVSKGMAAERERILAAAARVGREPGINGGAVDRLVSERSPDAAIFASDPVLRITSAGLWLMLLDDQQRAWSRHR